MGMTRREMRNACMKESKKWKQREMRHEEGVEKESKKYRKRRGTRYDENYIKIGGIIVI
jgi:hypothetical protein